MPEFAREYLDDIARPYTSDDLLNIAKGQIKKIEKCSEAETRIVFCDTELLTIKIWYEDKYGTLPQPLTSAVDTQVFDLYILCQPDFSWQPDPLRENPDRAHYFFKLYQAELENRGWLYIIASGPHNIRVQHTLKALSQLDNRLFTV